MESELEFFLVRSLVLKPAEKSLRRVQLSPKRSKSSLRIEYPGQRDGDMMVMPQTSIAGRTLDGKLIFVNRFSMLEHADDLPTPVVDTKTSYEADIDDEDSPNLDRSLRMKRFQFATQWGDEGICHRFKMRIPENGCSFLSHKAYGVYYTSGLAYRYQSDPANLLLIRLGSIALPSTSYKQIDMLRGALFYGIHLLSKRPEYETEGFVRFLATILSRCLRNLLLQLEWLNKSTYHFKQSGSLELTKPRESKLLEERIQALEALVWLVNSPLETLMRGLDSESRSQIWLCRVEERLAQAKASLADHAIDRLSSEQIYDWQLVSLEESSEHWWTSFFGQADPSTLSEFEDRIKTVIPRSLLYLQPEDAPESDAKDLADFFDQLPFYIDIWNQLAVRGDQDPGFVATRSACFAQPRTRQKIQPGLPIEQVLPLAPSITSYANSFLLPQGARKTARILEVAKEHLLLRVLTEANSWSFEVFTSRNPNRTELDSKFSLSKPGVWSFRCTFDWSILSDQELEQPNPWEIFSIDFTLEQVYLLCANQAELALVTFDPLSTEEDRGTKRLNITSPCECCTAVGFADQIYFFSDILQEPHRSHTFRWIESHKCLLWAVLHISNHQEPDSLIDVKLCLSAFALRDGALALETRLVSFEGQEWLCINKGDGTKTEMDVRHNPNLSLYFSWRVVADRCIGVWLRSRGGYRIYAKMKHRFVLCAQKSSSKFADYFMTELLPTTPGLCGTLPMILRKNETIRLTFNSCSFDLVELQVKIN